jgi:hypothetical protein
VLSDAPEVSSNPVYLQIRAIPANRFDRGSKPNNQSRGEPEYLREHENSIMGLDSVEA